MNSLSLSLSEILQKWFQKLIITIRIFFVLIIFYFQNSKDLLELKRQTIRLFPNFKICSLTIIM